MLLLRAAKTMKKSTRVGRNNKHFDLDQSAQFLTVRVHLLYYYRKGWTLVMLSRHIQTKQ